MKYIATVEAHCNGFKLDNEHWHSRGAKELQWFDTLTINEAFVWYKTENYR